MPSPWQVLRRRTLLADAHLGIHAERVRLPAGQEIEPWYVIDAPHWVAVVPVLPDGRIVLIEQYRHGSQLVSRELPAGNIDAGEDAVDAARRELREETGYRGAGAAIPLGTLCPEPARSRATATGFLIPCQAEPEAQRLDAGEDIAVIVLPFAAVLAPDRAGIVHGTQLAFIHLAAQVLAGAGRQPA
jgi:ADP-ribose pyrophosphatase